jgi:predicted dehydrogenase
MSEHRLGIIGLGLMGREIVSAISRWNHLTAEVPRPVVTGICSPHDSSHEWFRSALPDLRVDTTDYRELLASPEVDIVYIAVPHNLHEEIYVAAAQAGKDILGEKPFGIDLHANHSILAAIEKAGVFARCASQFAYYPPAVRLYEEVREGMAGRILDVRAGFHHSSDLDFEKPINWKRKVATNGEYGVMGDLGFHIMYLPFRLGMEVRSVSAVLSNIVEQRPSPHGPQACETWDNATLLCEAESAEGDAFPLTLEMRRMAPGATNSWFLEVSGTKRAYRYSTSEPRTLSFCEVTGRQQAWSRLDMGYASALPAITGGIFEFGFPDAIQQMVAAFMLERDGRLGDVLGAARPAETERSHRVMTAALEAHAQRATVRVE